MACGCGPRCGCDSCLHAYAQGKRFSNPVLYRQDPNRFVTLEGYALGGVTGMGMLTGTTGLLALGAAAFLAWKMLK